MTVTTEPEVVSFGPSEVPTYKRIPIKFRYFRDDGVEEQTFNLVAKTMDIGAASRVMRLVARADSEEAADAHALLSMVALIGKFMDDTDGTKAKWAPVALGPKKGEVEGAPKRFRGPDGRIHTWDKAEGFLAHDKGSSRRRWLYLMDEDEDASVDLDALTKLLQFLMEIAGKDLGRA